MSWFFFAIFSAVASAAGDAVNNHRAMRAAGLPMLTCWQMFACAMPLFIAMIVYAGLPTSGAFWLILLLTMPAEYLVQKTFFLALTHGESSKLLPLFGLVPLLLLVIGLLRGDALTLFGSLGIVTVIAGTLVVAGFFLSRCSLRQIAADRGSRYICACACLCVLTSLGLKELTMHASVLATTGCYYLCTWLCMTPAALKEARQAGAKMFRFGWAEFGCAFLFVTSIFAYTTALSLASPAYVSAVRRWSSLLSVFLGWHYFDEEALLRRSIGSLLIIAGVAFIAFGQ